MGTKKKRLLWPLTFYLFTLLILIGFVCHEALAACPAIPYGPPSHVSMTLEGCRNNGGITLPDGSGKFICPDADYTSGNLGKGWNELDLVPYRITLDAGNAAPSSQTYTIATVFDYLEGGNPGYDVVYISPPVLNTDLSDASCTDAVVSDQLFAIPGLGGISQSVYRLVTVTQPKNTTCVYDYVGRLAIGAHLWPGASLHANLALPTTDTSNGCITTSGIGSRDVSIPVKEIQSQSISKDMTATQDTDYTWNITKSKSPATVNFGDTCAPGATLEKPVELTVEWEILPGTPGMVTVITNIYATNVASRVIAVNVSDTIYGNLGAGEVSLDTYATPSPVDVDANSTMLVLTHTYDAPANVTDLQDEATATYIDKVTQVPIPGQTTATASATIQPGTSTNTQAQITDVEEIDAGGELATLTFSVDSISLLGDSFDCTLGQETTGPCTWISPWQTDDGSVIFSKTVYLDEPSSGTSSMSDTATLNASDGFTTSSNASVTIQADAQVSLTITKTIPDILQGSETLSFDFDVCESDAGGNCIGGGYANTVTINFSAGQTSKFSTLTSLEPAYYKVYEYPVPHLAVTTNPQIANINLPTCSANLDFANAPLQEDIAIAKVRKVTIPTGHESGWEFTLTGPGVNEPIQTTGDTFVTFATPLETEGNYTITETPKAGWDNTGSSGDCSFTVDYPDDYGRVYECTYENTQRGKIIIEKQTLPDGSAQIFTFTGNVSGTLSDGQTAEQEVVPGTYSSTEDAQAGWDLTDISCDDADSSGTDHTATFIVDPGEIVKCTFTNTERGMVEVYKTVSGTQPGAGFDFEIRSGASTTSLGDLEDSCTTDAAGFCNFGGNKLVPGDYQFCETGMLPGWHSSLSDMVGAFIPDDGDINTPVDNSVVCVGFTLDPGETEVFNIDNTPPPGGDARTIGFWKNWTSCDGHGNQDPVLDTTLYSFPSNGVYIGLLFVDSCMEGVNILDKSTQGGDNKANDAAYSLAAQLLAAKLNVQAGAGTCAAAMNAITNAQSLLVSIGFNGNGDYLGPKVKGAFKNTRTQALNLADILDQYNNGNLCTP